MAPSSRRVDAPMWGGSGGWGGVRPGPRPADPGGRDGRRSPIPPGEGPDRGPTAGGQHRDDGGGGAGPGAGAGGHDGGSAGRWHPASMARAGPQGGAPLALDGVPQPARRTRRGGLASNLGRGRGRDHSRSGGGSP